MVPDELVTAAAEALRHPYDFSPARSEDIARIALAAAFAKLPECEEAKPVNVTTTQAVGWRECIAALAKWGQP